MQIQREEVADAEAKAQQKREVEALQRYNNTANRQIVITLITSFFRAGEDMSFKKQEAAAMLAASKRIVNRASVTLNSQPSSEIKTTTSSTTSNNEEGNPQATPERTRRSFVLSASSNRRSRSKTSPMIIPIDDVDKFISENQEEEGASGSTNVRRTISFSFYLCFIICYCHHLTMSS